MDIPCQEDLTQREEYDPFLQHEVELQWDEISKLLRKAQDVSYMYIVLSMYVGQEELRKREQIFGCLPTWVMERKDGEIWKILGQTGFKYLAVPGTCRLTRCGAKVGVCIASTKLVKSDCIVSVNIKAGRNHRGHLTRSHIFSPGNEVQHRTRQKLIPNHF